MVTAFQAGILLNVVSAGAVILLGLFLLVAKPRRGYTWAFGSFLILWGTVAVLGNVASLSQIEGDAAATRRWALLHASALIGLYLPLAYFASIYPTRHGLFARSGPAAVLLLAPAAAGAALLFLDPSLFFVGTRAPSPTTVSVWGPAYLAFSLLFSAAFYYAVISLATHETRAKDDGERRRTLFVLLGLLLFIASRSAESLVLYGASLAGSGLRPQDVAFAIDGALGTAVVVSVVVLLLRRPRPERERGWVLAASLAPVAIGIATGLSKVSPPFPPLETAGLMRILAAGLITYAIVRYEVFVELYRQLQEKARLLEERNRDLDDFAYVVSHDLQAPLRQVKGFLQLLDRRLDGKLDKKTQEIVDFAVQGGDRAQALVQDILEYSRAGKAGGPLVATSSGDALDKALTRLQLATEESGAQVTRDPLPAVRADPTQLAQVFQNLVGNAIKFRGNAPPLVHVSARRVQDEWQFSVRDNGIGIPPEHHDRIFGLFQRLHGPDEVPGSGAGLAICRRIIERHGGRIWVESRSGEGATFYFTLPALDGA